MRCLMNHPPLLSNPSFGGLKEVDVLFLFFLIFHFSFCTGIIISIGPGNRRPQQTTATTTTTSVELLHYTTHYTTKVIIIFRSSHIILASGVLLSPYMFLLFSS